MAILAKLIPSLLVISAGAWLISARVRRNKSKAGRLALISPTTIFVGGIVARYGIGSLLLGATPNESVLKGEFDQYLVSNQYSGETAWIWLLYLLGFVLGILIVDRICKPKRISTKSGSLFDGGFIRAQGKGGTDLSKIVRACGLVFLVYFLIGTMSSSLTGSLDRGVAYSYWAEQVFRPEAPFIALSRLRQMGYFLVPMMIMMTRSLGGKLMISAIALGPLSLGLVSGGRGEVLYPVAMMVLGTFVSGSFGRRGLIGMLVISFLVIGSVPYLAAYRDSGILARTSHTDFKERLGGLLKGVPEEDLKYRYQAFGREVYACSDAFLFKPENNVLWRRGFGDVNASLVKDIMVPRWLSNKRKFEKYDGSKIAQELMGTNVRNWYPCITTPADLVRRGGSVAVFLGGIVIGVVLGVVDVTWLLIGSTYGGLTCVLLIILPVSYVQAGMYGTIREIIWQVGWEMPKYIVTCLIVGYVLERLFQRVFRNR